jgi:single-strand DNA-binding protein
MINKVTLIGRVGGDPDVKRLENGTVVARFSLATSDSYKDKNGEFQETTEWHNVVAWRDLAERVEKYLKKGVLVYVEGKVTYRKYNDKEGVEKTVTDIVANAIRTLEKREGGTAAQSEPAPFSASQPASTDIIGDGGDLPF